MSSCNKFVFLSVLYNFASTSNLFKYLKRRYGHQLVKDLNYVIRLKGKCVRSKAGIGFLQDCLHYHVTPSNIKERVLKAKPKHAAGIERAFLRDELEKRRDFFKVVSNEYPLKLHKVCAQLSCMDQLRACKLLNRTTERLQEQVTTKNGKTLKYLIRNQIGEGVLRHSVIFNLANIELTDIEKDVLCRGLNFGVPPRLSQEMIAAEFELCWQQLERTTGALEQRKEECKATLAHLSHQYANTKIDRSGYPLGKEHHQAINELRRNKDVVILRPDKGNGVVILNREDYVEKMDAILNQGGKFERLGCVEKFDNTLQHERALQAFLLRALKKQDISKEVYERIRPVGSTRPRMYGLPKMHKAGVPLRPILSMSNAPQQEMAKWLGEILQPVVTKYGKRALKDTFEFCDAIEEFGMENLVDGSFMCSFDVVSLFTNIPLRETIDIALDSLYRDPQIQRPSQPEELLRKMLLKATTDVEFSFDGNMYKQVDGVAMGSSLGPTLANIFVGFQESRIEDEKWPRFYRRFVDDTFSVFLDEDQALAFFRVLNQLHPALQFTMESEADAKLPFMDVLVQRRNGRFLRSVYRKPTFTGLYTRWDSFAPTHQKVALIKSLSSRARKICSESMLEQEFEKLTNIFLENGYPTGVINKHLRFARKTKVDGSELSGGNTSTACIRLPWIGQKSSKFQTEITDCIAKGFPNVKVRVIFTTRKAFSGRGGKDFLPATAQGSVVYEYTCRCNRTYVGKTSQLLGERVKQHVPDRLFLNLRGRALKVSPGDSAITKHLSEADECVDSIVSCRSRFTILARARNSQHLDVLEALFIRSKSPVLCQQKKSVSMLKLT